MGISIEQEKPHYVWLEYGATKKDGNPNGFAIQFDDEGYLLVKNKVTNKFVRVHCSEIIEKFSEKSEV